MQNAAEAAKPAAVRAKPIEGFLKEDEYEWKEYGGAALEPALRVDEDLPGELRADVVESAYEERRRLRQRRAADDARAIAATLPLEDAVRAERVCAREGVWPTEELVADAALELS